MTQPDSIVPNPANPQDWNRYAYARNNPLRYTDPSGHIACDDQDENGKCINYEQNLFRKISKNYSTWERQILRKLYDKGGPNAVHGVDYIVANDIHITVGDPINLPIDNGDWQSLGSTAGWFDPKSNSIVLNPNAGYKSGEMPDTWGLATIIHEAKHLEQGSPLTKYKELEAMQIGIDVAINLGGYYGGPAGKPGQQPDSSSRDGLVLALSLSHDPAVINAYSEILHDDPDSYWYWFFYNFLPIDSPRP
jgi:hypothetical protein